MRRFILIPASYAIVTGPPDAQEGRNWVRVSDRAGWQARAYHQQVVQNAKMYVFGGDHYVPRYHAVNDLCSSEDGVRWQQETEAALSRPNR